MPAEDTGSRAVPATRVACASRQCLKRKLVPEDIARAVLFFAADDSAACTAQSFVVDAGWT
jgi:NAD(P)-dependent dehydrogenase (short-subunit alcohol dehydrogenase family)